MLARASEKVTRLHSRGETTPRMLSRGTFSTEILDEEDVRCNLISRFHPPKFSSLREQRHLPRHFNMAF
jgi:hypothetical protein